MKPFSNISDIQFSKCVDSIYIKPRRMLYKENGFNRCWDFIQSMDSVAVMLYHKQKDSLLFVRQFRPAVFARDNHSLSSITSESKVRGYTYELCAGLVDKENKSLEQIAQEEVQEECGYKVKSLTYITTFAMAVGHSGANQSLFYSHIGEEDKISDGGGIDGEVIELVFIKVNELESFLYDKNITKTAGLGFGVLWFLRHYERLKLEAK